VRIEVANPGFLKLGMFATATFTSRVKETYAAVPADAVLHLHDRDWVFLPAGGNQFKRTEVHAGRMLSGNRQEILSGLQPGQQVVTNTLLLENAGNHRCFAHSSILHLKIAGLFLAARWCSLPGVLFRFATCLSRPIRTSPITMSRSSPVAGPQRGGDRAPGHRAN